MRALVTQSSLVLPMGALYTILLLRVAARLGVAEDVIDQGRRLVQIVSRPETAVQDAYGRWRLDDLELRDDVQAELWRRWEAVRTDTLGELGDLDRFDRDMRGVYGFDVAGVDYTASVDLVRTAPTVLTS